MRLSLVFLFLVTFAITKGDYFRLLEKLESKLDDNSEKLQEILSRLPNGKSGVEVLQEVAKGKASRQSLQDLHFRSGYAYDGNLNTFSITHTNDDLSPYWEVDLGHDFKIRQVEIFVRKDCCGHRIRQLNITAGSSHNQMTKCNFYKGPARTGDHLVFECNPIINGRYVRIQKMNHASNLALLEVKVNAVVDRTVG
ncbi:fucolectin-6-like [Mytilus trossulus]|uniref:fucolectin-6-like n=1 Tax=Mytilus trossulus TaxID=6551 RepID=UPI0030054B16